MSSDANQASSVKAPPYVLPIILFLLALLIRMWGIGWGLPNRLHEASYHPDEPVIYAYSQVVEPTKLSFTPGFYNYGTLYLTTLSIASDVVAAYTGGPDPKNPDTLWPFIGRVHMAGRIISALAGAGTVLIVFIMLRRFTSDLGAAFGALLIAFAPAHVVHSRFQTVDILATFFLAVSAFYALKFLDKDPPPKQTDLKLAILSGVFAGLSAGTKYTGILCLVTLFVILFMYRREAWVKLAGIGTAAALAVFVLTTPGILLDTAAFMRDFRYEMAHTSTGHGLIFEGTSSGFMYHLSNLFTGIGTIVALIGFAGLLFATFRRHGWAIALLAFFVLYYLLIGRAEVKFVRYTFPLYIGLAAGFGWVMSRARERGGSWHMAVALGILGLGGIDYGGLRGTAGFSTWMSSPDPRDVAAQALKGQDTTVGLVQDPWFYTPPYYPAANRRLVHQPEVGLAVMAQFSRVFPLMLAAQQPQVVRYVPTAPEGNPDLNARFDWDTRLLTDARPEYVVFSSFETEGLQRLKTRTDLSPAAKAFVERSTAFLDQLQQDYQVEKQYGVGGNLVHDMMYVQPTIWVWKRKEAASSTP